jgi:bcr-type benzoyl-CoA reductase subunit B
MGEKRDKISTAELQKELIGNYYQEAKEAYQTGRKVAWVTAAFPVEICYAMDIIPIYPENHAAVIGARKMGQPIIEIAQEVGYAQDLCSYALCDFGSIFSGQSPIGGLPKPDILLCCNNQCGTVTKWYEVLSRYFKVPLVVLDAPFVGTELNLNILTYFKEQLKELISILEELTGTSLNMDRLRVVLELSNKTSNLWRQYLEMGTHIPSPITCFDGFIHMAPIVTLRGTEKALGYYQLLIEETEERLARGFSAVPEEKYRLFWDNLPIWFQLRGLAEKFARHQANIVGASYTSLWAYSFQPGDPLNTLAQNYCDVLINRGIETRAAFAIEMLEKYSAHGLVMHSNRSCKPYSFGQYTIQKLIQERSGKPSLILEADICDPRLYQEEQIEEAIDAFFDTLAATSN